MSQAPQLRPHPLLYTPPSTPLLPYILPLSTLSTPSVHTVSPQPIRFFRPILSLTPIYTPSFHPIHSLLFLPFYPHCFSSLPFPLSALSSPLLPYKLPFTLLSTFSLFLLHYFRPLHSFRLSPYLSHPLLASLSTLLLPYPLLLTPLSTPSASPLQPVITLSTFCSLSSPSYRPIHTH